MTNHTIKGRKRLMYSLKLVPLKTNRLKETIMALREECGRLTALVNGREERP